MIKIAHHDAILDTLTFTVGGHRYCGTRIVGKAAINSGRPVYFVSCVTCDRPLITETTSTDPAFWIHQHDLESTGR